jgi:hypothetical protein
VIVRCPVRGISDSDEELDHVSGLLYLCEIDNFEKFGQIFCA